MLYQAMTYRTDRGYPKTQVDMASLRNALQSYQACYDKYPLGGSSEILAALRGGNPRTVVFLYVSGSDTNASGEFVDPWQTPYQIVFDSTNHFTIRSAGKNKRFGDDDDFKLSSQEER